MHEPGTADRAVVVSTSDELVPPIFTVGFAIERLDLKILLDAGVNFSCHRCKP
jgi:hypothetical protein